MGGGASIFIKKTMQYVPREDLKLDIDKNFANSCFVEINKTSVNNKKHIIIGCIYKAAMLSISHLNDKMEALLNRVAEENKEVYLLGDMNINLGDRCSNNLQTQEFRNLLSTYSFTPLIHRPTRITPFSATIIDNIFTNVSSESIIYSRIFATKAYSDHFPIFSTINNKLTENNNKTFKRRNFSEKNISKFRKTVNRSKWYPIYNNTDTGSAFSFFHDVMQLHLRASFPEEIIEHKYMNRYPWLNKSLRASIVKKMSIQSQLDPDNDTLHEEYKKYKNNVTSLLRNAELLYYSEQLETNKHDIAKSWKIIKDITGLSSSKSTNVFFNINGITVSDKTIIAQEFNNFFVNIGPELANSITSTVNPLSYVNNVMYSIVISTVSEHEIMQIVSILKNSSAGWDEIPASVGKKCIQSYIKPLTHIINMSLREGVFPYELKLAKVIPIYKSGDKTLLTNYRPISILPFFFKFLKR